jgi:hypothetical protein
LVPANGGTPAPTPLVIATTLTPFSWGRPIIGPVFGVRFLLQPLSSVIFNVHRDIWA